MKKYRDIGEVMGIRVQRGFVITIGMRLFIGFMTLGLPLLLLILFLTPKVDSLINHTQEIQKENLSQVLDTGIYQTQDIIDHWIITNDDKDKARFDNAWVQINMVRGQWNKGLHELSNQKILHDWGKLQKLYEPLYKAQSAIMYAIRKPGDFIPLHTAFYHTFHIKQAMLRIIDGASTENSAMNDGLYHEIMQLINKNTVDINNELKSIKNLAYSLLSFAIFLIIMVPLITLRSISVPINNAINIAERIAAGERNVAIDIKSEDKMGKLLLSLKTMQEAIRKNEETLSYKEEESRELFEKLVDASRKFCQHSSKVAAGDLRERLELDKEDILLDLGKDLNLMTDGLASITKKITTVSNELVNLVGTVLTSANEQTEGITSQASAISEISASLEEIDKSSKQTMEKAQALREIAKNTYEQGKLGTEAVRQSINGIKASEEKMKLIAHTIMDLSNHTQQIGDITSVVNTMSQQSKMLALNASIEAYKAGEAGKGFAAVATEVRNLAEQSEQATIQVQKIIEDIRRSTEKAVAVTEKGAKTLDSGTKLIEKAGDVIQALSKMINEASISSQHIEVAIRQETVGIEQIVNSMKEINQVTSTFSSGIKEMMTFIHRLDAIAKHLKEDVNIYKV